MSLRAIRKRENTNLTATANTIRSSLFRKSCKNKIPSNNLAVDCSSTSKVYREDISNICSNHLNIQYKLLGRNIRSNPELEQYSQAINRKHHLKALRTLVRSKSDSDVYTLANNDKNKSYPVGTQRRLNNLLNAKSEICLKTIAAYNYQQQQQQQQQRQQQQQFHINNVTQHNLNSCYNNLLSTARSHRDLTQSYYPTTNSRRRMSDGASYAHSARYNSLSTTNDITLSSNHSLTSTNHALNYHGNNTALRIPIIGYEVMEERARFTVYKLRVENPHTNDCWLVLRRYTDFVRLNNKLKISYPHYTALNLPRKKFFGDNFKADFLDQRVQGLQMFVNAIMSNDELRKSQLVREFFCLDEPPTYSESMEECRAIFEAQEETIAHLKVQLMEKNDLILELQQKLTEAIQESETCKKLLKNLKANHKSDI